MFLRIFGLFIFVLALALAYTTYDQFKEEIDWMTATPGKRIAIIVEEDFRNLAKAKELPAEWGSLTKVVYKMESPVTRALMGENRPQLQFSRKKEKPNKSADGYEAEIEVIDLPDEKEPGFILQLSLFNMKTQNKIFEIGRTYYFSELNKKKPD